MTKPLFRPHVLSSEAISQLSHMKLEIVSQFVDDLAANATSSNLSFNEKMELIISRLYQYKSRATVERMRKRAKLREPEAFLDTITFDERRNLNRTEIIDLCTCDFLRGDSHLCIEGPTGCGKTYLACAIANEAINKGFSALYFRMPMLQVKLEELCEDSAFKEKKSSKYLAFINKLTKPAILILDEWLAKPLTVDLKECLNEVFDIRASTGGTIFCSQVPQHEWLSTLGENKNCEALIDRVIHNMHTLQLGDLNMRELTSKRHRFS